MKVVYSNFDYEDADPDVIAYCSNDFWTKRDILKINIRNHASVKPEFVKFLQKHIDIIYILSGLSETISQNHMKDWHKWLIENYDANTWSNSPYSASFYNSKDIDWDYKPEGSLRLSDHWNFYTREKMHCETDDPEFKDGWAVGEYHNGKYKIIKKFND